ncbi:hypothetical protein L249_1225 [Ophiocordyceps polyrhachis-furcata BCC 54312]|uniref:Uncharacterized protein n=1 Tax=Ophiocordyceps polyrhachis-furcata BCC 54312 TaxID=1330021 RepID=A0A367LG33_9HYPO|nr:hypothetical protein L249_1225 [Ophiocordyceps polyrhachis-furcata BCC 54312]
MICFSTPKPKRKNSVQEKKGNKKIKRVCYTSVHTYIYQTTVTYKPARLITSDKTNSIIIAVAIDVQPVMDYISLPKSQPWSEAKKKTSYTWFGKPAAIT